MLFMDFSLLFVFSVGAAVLTEPLLQRGLSQGPLQIPVEPAAGQPLPNPMVTGRKARPTLTGTDLKSAQEVCLTAFFNAPMISSCTTHLKM